MIENFDTFKKIHFIGIGGIGISAVARMLILDSKSVTGSDTTDSIVISGLRDLGINVSIGENENNLPNDTELVIYTIAISETNKEFQKAKRLGIPILTYPESLAIISKNKKTIAITGTHGKTTTTSMIGHVMYDLGLDPTVIVGSLLKEWNGNFLPGTSEYFVVEGCEYRRSFLNLHPHVLIITNIEVDHLDYYKDIEDIKSAFKELALRVPTDGMIIADMENEHVISVLEDIAAPIVNYKNFDLDGIKLKVPGRYNLENAKAAFATVQSLDGGEGKIKKSLETFAGAWRRFEYKGQLSNGAVVYDDYAHHPTEIQSFLTAVREHFSDKKILAIFQPHLHSRTEDFLEGFAASLAIADEIIILPIFEAREEISHNVSAEDLVEKIRSLGKDAKAMDFEKVSEVVKSKDNNWFIATIGAGKTNTLAEALVKNI